MTTIPVIMPKFEMAQESGTIARWLKQVGDAVRKGEAILEVETDKLTMEVESPADGVLSAILAEAGAVVPIGQPIAYLAPPGMASAQPTPQAEVSVTDAGAAPTPRATPIAEKIAAEHGVDLRQVKGTGRGGQITRQDVEAYLAARAPGQAPAVAAGAPPAKLSAAPAARRLARELNVPLSEVGGSGPQGRIQSSDVERAAAARRESGLSTTPAAVAPTAAAQPPAPPGLPAVRRRVPLSGMRRIIAQRMSQSTREAPQFNISVDVNMARALALVEDWRAVADPAQPKVTLTALLVRACAWALARNPALNAGFEDNAIVEWQDVNIGVAVAVEEGLLVPVIQRADALSLAEIAARLNDLTTRARSNRLQPADLQGGTFTLSNLGMFAVDRFTAIVNPPQAAILAVGRAAKRLVVNERDEPQVMPVATLTVSADHRVVDGAQVGRFLSDLQLALERPGLLL